MVHPDYVSEDEAVFEGLGIEITTGCHFLGCFIGEGKKSVAYVNRKIEVWLSGVDKLSRAAAEQPQVSYVALVKSLQAEWLFLQRVIIAKCENAFAVLRSWIADVFWLAVFGRSVDKGEVRLFSLPIRLGGLGVRDPVDSAASLSLLQGKCPCVWWVLSRVGSHFLWLITWMHLQPQGISFAVVGWTKTRWF